MLAKTGTGTLICLSNFDRDNFSRRKDVLRNRLTKYFSYTYCEMITSSKVKIFVDEKEVTPKDPLCWFHKDVIKVWDKPIPGTNARLRIVNLKNVPREFVKPAMSRQGGYIYRCNRLIEESLTGENKIWNGKIPNRHNGHNWCRWGIFYDASDDDRFNTSFDKSEINPSQSLLDRVGEVVTTEANIMFTEKNRKDKKNLSEEDRIRQKNKTNKLANTLAKKSRGKYNIVKDGNSLKAEEKVIPLPVPQNKLPLVVVKSARLGPTGEPAMMIPNEDVDESKFVMQINEDNPYISRFYMSDDEELSRQAVEAWLLPLYLTLQGMPDDDECNLMDFRIRFSDKLRQATLELDKS